MDSIFSVMGSYVIRDVKSLLLFTAVFILIADYIKNRRPASYPPGPWEFPTVGNIFTVDHNRAHESLTQLAGKYGDVYSLRMGQTWMVVLNGFQVLKEALVNQGDSLVDRPDLPLQQDITHGLGVIFSSGNTWKQQRHFALSTLRYFGFGKKSLEPLIFDEFSHCAKDVNSYKGKPFNPHLIVNKAVSNIISSLVFGHRFEYGDEKFIKLMKWFDKTLQIEASIWAQLYNSFPLLMRRLPGPHQTVQHIWNNTKDFIRGELKEHKQHWDPSDLRDYIDCYLNEIQMSKGQAYNTFDEENLVMCVLDLFVAGSETTSTTLRWAFLYMAKYLEIQEKVQAEIDRVIGQSRQPSMEDRANLPYTDAVIHEVQRMGNIVPLSLPHVTNRDVQLGGYTVPKGVIVIPNLTSVLFDKNEWETPFTFNPGHFLNEEGQFVKRAAFIPFSAGKRVCLGENLARMELFLLFTSFMQRFTFSMPPGVEPVLKPRFGVTLAPHEYEVCATSRLEYDGAPLPKSIDIKTSAPSESLQSIKWLQKQQVVRMDQLSGVSVSSVWLDGRSLLLFTLVFLVIAEYLRNRRPSSFPPGPWAFPLVGNIFSIDFNNVHGDMTKLAEKYGNVYSLKMGPSWMVVLNGLSALQEGLLTKGDMLADRPELPLHTDVLPKQGIIFASGHMWKQQRQFALFTLKYFGFGKKSLESSILDEFILMSKEIANHKGKPFNPHLIMNNGVSNIICSLIFGHRFEYGDETFLKLIKLLDKATRIEGSIWAQLYNAFPVLMRRLPGPHRTLQQIYGETIDLMKTEINKHKEDWDPSEPRDFIDCYLNEIQKDKKGDEADAGFDEDNLVMCSFDLFGAGTETTSTTLRWALLYMAKYTEIQEKVQAEIDRVIGQSRQPSMEDRANLPYTDAVIHEVQRMGNIVPLSLPHVTNRDVQLGGYTVPKGVIVIPNLTSVLFDKNEWETPFTFNPGHFLNEEGKFVKRAAFIPFSAGNQVSGCVSGRTWPGWSSSSSSPPSCSASPSPCLRVWSLC
ncbi:uncharacterized protein LOC122877915 [Siniperca chuatsi]|uniref:uncharacterized protein LOC122877915 n=1 Tax=Siniperca chuatsi TaxID=119488 RepID=UPI001CE1EBE8|nr:uncharacterized protein LOC122877915 [Siniperca chuatsi]